MLRDDTRQRLERLSQWALKGRRAEAELELHEWLRQDAPDEARAMLSTLLARRGEAQTALQILGNPARRKDQPLDPEEAQLAIAVLLCSDHEDEARRLAAWLYHEHGHEPEVAGFVDHLDVPGLNQLPAAADSTVQRLADELSAQVEVVPSLVYAQKQQPNLRTISLLRAATKRLAETFADEPEMPRLVQALAELAMLVGDEDDARRWAHHGLRLEPFNAVLALLLGQVEDDEALGPPAAETLKRVALRFPGYPDVQRAYAQRLESDRLQGKVA